MSEQEESVVQNATIFQHRISSDKLNADIKEVYRYAGIFAKERIESGTELETLAQESIQEIFQTMNCRSVYIRFPLTILETQKINEQGKKLFLVEFSNIKIKTHSLAENLQNCHAIYLFAATLGPTVDKAIQKASKLNAAKAILLQASATMFIEQYCDELAFFLNAQEQKQNNVLKPRFSPGYGDIPLEIQKTFFELLNCQKNLALTLNDSLIMSPEKSVTAFIGVKKNER